MKFVFDLDGTLCFDGYTINKDIIEALERLKQAEHEVIFASARPIRDMLPVLPKQFHHHKLIGGNGCYTSHNGNIEISYFEENLLETLKELVERNEMHYLADSSWDYAFTGLEHYPAYQNISHETANQLQLHELDQVCKMVLFSPSEDILQELSQLPVVLTHYKGENAVDLSPLGINKANGLQKLAVTEFVAFGNDSNDRCMFERAIFSVCVGDNEVGKYASKIVTRTEVANQIKQLVAHY